MSDIDSYEYLEDVRLKITFPFETIHSEHVDFLYQETLKTIIESDNKDSMISLDEIDPTLYIIEVDKLLCSLHEKGYGGLWYPRCELYYEGRRVLSFEASLCGYLVNKQITLSCNLFSYTFDEKTLNEMLIFEPMSKLNEITIEIDCDIKYQCWSWNGKRIDIFPKKLEYC